MMRHIIINLIMLRIVYNNIILQDAFELLYYSNNSL